MIVAHSLFAVLLLRALAGVGDALFFVLASTAVYELAPEDQHASSQSRFTAVISAGILLGPIVAETLRDQVGYTGIWLLGAGLCGAASAAVIRLPLAREPSTTNRLNVIERSAVLPGVAIAGVTWGLSAFTIFVALYASRLGLHNANGPFVIVAVIVLTLRTVGAPVFDHVRSQLLGVFAILAVTVGLALLALLPDRRVLLAGSALIAVGQALAFPALLQLAVERAVVINRTRTVATFSGFYEAGLASSAIALGALLDRLGFRGMYGVAAAVSVTALMLLLLNSSGRQRHPGTVSGPR